MRFAISLILILFIFEGSAMADTKSFRSAAQEILQPSAERRRAEKIYYSLTYVFQGAGLAKGILSDEAFSMLVRQETAFPSLILNSMNEREVRMREVGQRLLDGKATSVEFYDATSYASEVLLLYAFDVYTAFSDADRKAFDLNFLEEFSETPAWVFLEPDKTQFAILAEQYPDEVDSLSASQAQAILSTSPGKYVFKESTDEDGDIGIHDVSLMRIEK